MFIWQALYKLIKLFRTLSLDIVGGALAISYFITSSLRQSLPFFYWIALGFTVWLIYMVDHYADSYLPGSYSNKTELLQLRSYRKIMSKLILFAVLTLLVITFLLPLKIILFGLIGVLFMITYTILNQVQNYSMKAFFPRELVIALFYTTGTAGIPVLYAETLTRDNLLLILAVFFLVLGNTIIFACLDYDHDEKAGIKTMAIRLSPRKTRLSGILTLLISASVFVYLSYKPVFFSHAVIGLSMLLPLLLILIFLKRFRKPVLAFLADLVLMLPLVLLFV